MDYLAIIESMNQTAVLFFAMMGVVFYGIYEGIK